MDSTSLLSTLLVSIGYRLPILIALGVALVMLFDAPRGRVRAAAMTALGLLFSTTVLGGVASALPLLLIARGDFSGIGSINTLLTGMHLVLSLVEAVAFIVLAWAVVQALRRPVAAGNA